LQSDIAILVITDILLLSVAWSLAGGAATPPMSRSTSAPCVLRLNLRTGQRRLVVAGGGALRARTFTTSWHMTHSVVASPQSGGTARF